MFKLGEKVTDKYTYKSYIVTNIKSQYGKLLYEIGGYYYGDDSMIIKDFISQLELRKLKIEKIRKNVGSRNKND